MDDLLTIRGMTKVFGRSIALDGADLEVAPGEVHALLGANGSGKSTIIKILAGYHQRDAGEVTINGEAVPHHLPSHGVRDYGVSFVHQDLGLAANATVLEHFALARSSRPGSPVNWRTEERDVSAMLADYGLDTSPNAFVRDLRPVECAEIAIVRAVRQSGTTSTDRPRLLVLDEPTVFLPRNDVIRLFGLIRRLRDRGDSVILVSHDIDEVLEIADRITVLRDGRTVATVPAAGSGRDDVVALILGKEVEHAQRATRVDAALDRPVNLAVENLSGGSLRTASFELRAGEVVGVTGLAGSGYEDIAELLYGSMPGSADRFVLGGREIHQRTPRQMLRHGVALVPADRKRLGGAGRLKVIENIALPLTDREFRRGRIGWKRVRKVADRICTDLAVKPNDPDESLERLSGGNQQKVIIGKWLETQPRVLLLNEPTQGVDIGARAEIFTLLRSSVAAGTSALCATSDYEQLVEIADRVLVVRGGRVVAELNADEIDKQRIARAVFGAGGAQGDAD